MEKEGKIESINMISDKERIIERLQGEISRLVDKKTVTTLEDLSPKKTEKREDIPWDKYGPPQEKS